MAEELRRPTKRARSLRNDATEHERLLWFELRKRRFNGHKFSRQIPIGPFICDFVCRREMLVIELDGGQHSANVEKDMALTRFIETAGYRVLRFWNHEVVENLDGVLQTIGAAIEACPPGACPPPAPPASGRGA